MMTGDGETDEPGEGTDEFTDYDDTRDGRNDDGDSWIDNMGPDRCPNTGDEPGLGGKYDIGIEYIYGREGDYVYHDSGVIRGQLDIYDTGRL